MSHVLETRSGVRSAEVIHVKAPNSSRSFEEPLPDESRNRKIFNASDHFIQYRRILAEIHGLEVVPVSGDGNCLFRSVSHQVYGDEQFHDVVRQKCLDYMEVESEFFSQFIEGGMATFSLYCQVSK
jgi:OTU domain-containing protein 5